MILLSSISTPYVNAHFHESVSTLLEFVEGAGRINVKCDDLLQQLKIGHQVTFNNSIETRLPPVFDIRRGLIKVLMMSKPGYIIRQLSFLNDQYYIFGFNPETDHTIFVDLTYIGCISFDDMHRLFLRKNFIDIVYLVRVIPTFKYKILRKDEFNQKVHTLCFALCIDEVNI